MNGSLKLFHFNFRYFDFSILSSFIQSFYSSFLPPCLPFKSWVLPLSYHASMLVDILNASVGFLSFMLEIWCSKLYFYFRLPDIFLYYLIQTMQGDQEKGHIHLVFLPSSLLYLLFINCFFFFPPFFYIFFLFT